MIFAQDRMGFAHPPKLFLKQDIENSKNVFGKTAHYDPQDESVTVFVTGRHPKDILRSLAHELVHHTQNLRGDLSPEKCGSMGPGYAQENPHMREMERQAYEQGSMCFRDFEDMYKKQLEEVKFLKESKKMAIKISKNELKNLIGKLLKERVSERQATSVMPQVATDNGDDTQIEDAEVFDDDKARIMQRMKNKAEKIKNSVGLGQVTSDITESRRARRAHRLNRKSNPKQKIIKEQDDGFMGPQMDGFMGPQMPSTDNSWERGLPEAPATRTGWCSNIPAHKQKGYLKAFAVDEELCIMDHRLNQLYHGGTRYGGVNAGVGAKTQPGVKSENSRLVRQRLPLGDDVQAQKEHLLKHLKYIADNWRKANNIQEENIEEAHCTGPSAGKEDDKKGKIVLDEKVGSRIVNGKCEACTRDSRLGKCDMTKTCEDRLRESLEEQMTDPDAPMSVSVKPDFPDVDGDGDTKEPISQAQKQKKEKEGGNSKKKSAKPKKGEVPPQLRKHVQKRKEGQNESKIFTPEQEQELYESRFNNRNEQIFDTLKKLWTK